MFKERVEISLRRAEIADVFELEDMIHLSVWELGRADYSLEQVQSLVKDVGGVDLNLIEDGTLFIAEYAGQIVGCGGWSRRTALFTGDTGSHGGSQATFLNPAFDAARIRMIFVHPDFARQGIGRQLLEFAELCARQAGFSHLQLLATLTGVPLYLRAGYEMVERKTLTLADGMNVTAVMMEKYLD